MNTDLKIRQAKLSRWAVLFQKQASCGLHVKTWCDRNGISIHACYYWKHIYEYFDYLLTLLSAHADDTGMSFLNELLHGQMLHRKNAAAAEKRDSLFKVLKFCKTAANTAVLLLFTYALCTHV